MSHRQRFTRLCAILAIKSIVSVECAAQMRRVDGAPQLAVRDLLITDKDNDWSFQQIYSLTIDNRGRIYAWDSEDFKIRVFDAAGKPVRLLGRKGQGPGELSQVGHLTISDDTLWVSESFSNRVTAFALNSEGFRTTTVVPKSGGSITAKLSNGFLVSVKTKSFSNDGTKTEVIDRAGTSRATIVSFSPTPRVLKYDVVQENVKGGPVVGRQVAMQPYLVNVGLHTFPDGSGFVSATLADAIDNVVVLRSIADNGTQLWESRTQFQPIPFSEADFRKAVDNLVAPTVVNGMRIVGKRQMIIDSMVRPKYWPAFTTIILGIDKTIWLKSGSHDTDESVYWQFSAKGVFERRVRVPAGVRILAASQSLLWGTRRDADGNPVIERFVIK